MITKQDVFICSTKLGSQKLPHLLETRARQLHLTAAIIKLFHFFHCEAEFLRNVADALVDDMEVSNSN